MTFNASIDANSDRIRQVLGGLAGVTACARINVAYCAILQGTANILCGHPFDTIKVRMQKEGMFGRFNGPVDCLRQTVRHEGFAALYKGALPPLLGKAMSHMTMFGVYGAILEALHPTPSLARLASNAARGSNGSPFRADIPLSSAVLAGSLTGVVCSVLVTPLDQVKVTLQVQYHRVGPGPAGAALSAGSGGAHAPVYRGTWDCARGLIRQHGFWGGLYKQQLATTVEMSLLGFWFGGYHAAKRALSVPDGTPDGHLSAPRGVLAGGVGGMAMALTSFPVDVVKHRLMTQQRVPGRPELDPYQGIVDCARKVWTAEGPRAFYRGLTPGLLRTFTANGGTFFAFEAVNRFLQPPTWTSPPSEPDL